MGIYLRPGSLGEALKALASGTLTVVAGGTDFYPARVGRPLDEDVLDVTAIPDLGGVSESDDHFRIGATTTWTEIAKADLPAMFDGLRSAAREVGGVQIQNAGTIGGNLCNASPAADGVPPLLTLEARVELRSETETEVLPLAEFITGNRATVLGRDRLMTAVLVPKPRRPAIGRFRKLGARRYLVISIVAAAAVVEVEDSGVVGAARVAVGACSPVACRLAELEEALIGRPCDGRLGEVVAEAHLAPLAPIDDIRATAAYRRDAALTLVRRLLDELGRAA